VNNRIPLIEVADLREELQEELCSPASDNKLPLGIESPAILIRRHERSTSFGDSYGFPKATHIDGYDERGNHIATKSLLERQSRVGRVAQMVVEVWKVDRMRNILWRNPILYPLSPWVGF
jgi:hypothetical protein